MFQRIFFLLFFAPTLFCSPHHSKFHEAVVAFDSSDASNWYKGGNFYQIYPRYVFTSKNYSQIQIHKPVDLKIDFFVNFKLFRSYKDSNNDGIGDLNGITSKIEYLKEIGIDGVW